MKFFILDYRAEKIYINLDVMAASAKVKEIFETQGISFNVFRHELSELELVINSELDISAGNQCTSAFTYMGGVVSYAS